MTPLEQMGSASQGTARSLTRRGLFGVAIAGGAALFAACSRAVRSHGVQELSVSPTEIPHGSPSVALSPSATATPSPPSSLVGPAVEISRGSANSAAVALTFHGAGDIALARALFKLLVQRQVQITVMAVGTWLLANPAIATEIIAAGHELGNHTWTHPALAQMSESQVRSEVQRCRDLLVQLTGHPGLYFRQSSAQTSTPLIRSVAGSLGYRTCLSYDVDSLDWTDPGVATVRQAVKTATSGSVVSLHLGHRVTIEAMPGILDDLTNRGLTPVTTSQLLAIS